MSADRWAFLLCALILFASAAWSVVSGEALYLGDETRDDDFQLLMGVALNLLLAVASVCGAWLEP